MRVLRNTYKSRQIAYDDDAYNLPLDTIYFIESTWNFRLNEYVRAHKREIEELLHRDIGGFFCYQFEIISSPFFLNSSSCSVIKELHPALGIEFNFMARIAPHEERLYEFYSIDVSATDENYIHRVLEKYVIELNYLNLRALTQKDVWRNYHIQSKRVSQSNTKEGGIFSHAIGSVSIPVGGVASLSIEHIDKLHIDPKLRELARRIDAQIKEYQRDYGDNILLESIYEDFLHSFSRLEKQEISALVIDEGYRIYLKEFQKEIKMYSFPKAVYIFFLRHPEGLYLKDISDYREELHRIYRTIMRYEWKEDVTAAKIDSLLDLSNGVLNQYICRIAESFRKVLSSELTCHYIVSGKRNEIRRVTLDGSKICLPESLKF